MKRDSLPRWLIRAALLAACVLGPDPVVGDDSADQALLRQKTLRSVGAYYVLADEPKLNAMFNEVRTLQRKLADANRQLQLVEGKVQQDSRTY